jgi:hypothetical protein
MLINNASYGHWRIVIICPPLLFRIADLVVPFLPTKLFLMFEYRVRRPLEALFISVKVVRENRSVALRRDSQRPQILDIIGIQLAIQVEERTALASRMAETALNAHGMVFSRLVPERSPNHIPSDRVVCPPRYSRGWPACRG